MDIRAAELTADHLGLTVRINAGDPSLIVGRLVSIRHKQVGKGGTPETETRLEVEVPGGQRIRAGFSSIGVVKVL